MNNTLLSIVEMGGYRSLTPVYEQLGFEVTVVHDMRKAMKLVRKIEPGVIVTEFNYQTDFRDRSSTLESLMATLHWQDDVHVIVLYDKKWQDKLDAFLTLFSVHACLPFPLDEQQLINTLSGIIEQTG